MGDGIEIDEELVSLIGHAVNVFGPKIRVAIRINDKVYRFSFPPDPSWTSPRVKPVAAKHVLRRRA